MGGCILLAMYATLLQATNAAPAMLLLCAAAKAAGVDVSLYQPIAQNLVDTITALEKVIAEASTL